MTGLAAIGYVAWLRDLLPPATPEQTRRHLILGVVLRWVLIAVIAAGGMLTPGIAGFLLYLLAAAAIYNAGVTLLLTRASFRWQPGIALLVTSIDQVFCFVFLGVYSAVVAGSQPLGGYSMGTIEAVMYFGVFGAVLSVGLFIACLITVVTLGLPIFGHTFSGPGGINSVVLVSMIAVVLVSVLRTRLVPARITPSGGDVVAAPGNGAVHLSKRELEVLQLVAEGYSNAMIAHRLRLSDNTVKGYVENMLTHLNARNRAEAVAMASRLKLL